MCVWPGVCDYCVIAWLLSEWVSECIKQERQRERERERERERKKERQSEEHRYIVCLRANACVC